jgi:palmitoyltransferase
MEMGNLAGDAAQKDIMQLARVGDIAAMEKLFESGEFDATYTDDEGITPLHVRQAIRLQLVVFAD